MSRKNAREDSFRIIFQSLINKLEISEYLDDYFASVEHPKKGGDTAFVNNPTGTDNDYVKEAVDGTLSHSEELDNIIAENLVGWDMNRISKVSIAAMRLALYEIIYMDSVPTSVAINEAVEISKRYDGIECGAFVNGALGSAVKKLGK